jgi:hypothetical protein
MASPEQPDSRLFTGPDPVVGNVDADQRGRGKGMSHAMDKADAFEMLDRVMTTLNSCLIVGVTPDRAAAAVVAILTADYGLNP